MEFAAFSNKIISRNNQYRYLKWRFSYLSVFFFHTRIIILNFAHVNIEKNSMDRKDILNDQGINIPKNGYANLTNDYMFKRIFGSEECKDILITFLNHIIGDCTITNVSFQNKLNTGSVKLVKETSCSEHLEGWQVGLYTDAACTQLVSGSPFTSKDDGTIIAQVAPGTYFIEEINPPADYPDWDLDDGCHIVTVNAGETASVWFENIHYGYAEIVKQTNTGDNLSGWKFNIYTDAACTQLVEGSPFTTGDTGTITTRLLPGDYYVQEVDESEQNPGWTYDTTVRKVSVVASDTKSVTFTNTHSGKVKIIKSMPDGGSVAGWIFEVYKADGTTLVGTYTTTEDGTIVSDYLLPGEYVIKEIIPEDSLYVCESPNPQTVTVTGGQTAEVTFTNRLLPGEIGVEWDELGAPFAVLAGSAAEQYGHLQIAISIPHTKDMAMATCVILEE